MCVCVVLLSVGSSVRSRHRNARACSVVLLAPKKGAVLVALDFVLASQVH